MPYEQILSKRKFIMRNGIVSVGNAETEMKWLIT